MPQSVVNNKRIAKNTLFLYLRMLFVMGVTLYTSRVVLEALGVVDFGIYNVVGGLSATFVFFSSALTNATQRFLNYEHGRGRKDKLNNIFNLSLVVYCSIAVFIVAIGFIFGTWFVKNKLSIPPASLDSACVVLYMTLFSLLFSFIGSVYESVLISRENMKIYAYLGIVDAVGRLGCAYVVSIIPDYRLSVYAVLLAVVHIFPKILLIIFCVVKYEETRIKYYWNKGLFIEMFAFAGWNIYGTGVWMINQQGINIILNLFFGPVVNAARGIATQVTTAVTNIGLNFFTAVRPQIIKSYASDDIDNYVNLIFKSSKYSVFLLTFICLPFFLKTEYILSIWLKYVPEYTVTFTKWVLIFVLVDSLNNPLWCAIQAVGKLKKTILYGSTYYLLAFPLSYVALSYGAPSWVVYPIIVFFRATYVIIVFRILKTFVNLDTSEYIKTVVFPIVCVTSVSYILTQAFNLLLADSFINLIILLLASTVSLSLSIFFLGVSPSERHFITSRIVALLHKNK